MKIEKNFWNKCFLCNKNLHEIKKFYGGSNVYFSKAMAQHIVSHKISLEDYFEKIVKIIRPICKCGECNKKTKIILRNKNKNGFFWKEYACGRYEGSKKWSKDAKISRIGKNNPMFGKKPWNLGMNKKNSEYGKKMSLYRIGKKTSKESKNKQSISAKKRLIHGHTGIKHSEFSKKLMSIATLNRIKKGAFKHTKTKPHLLMKSILQKLKLNFEEEKIIECWIFDFWLKDYNLFIEVDGDYFHVNPKIYPNGPKTNTQKINFYRDKVKNKFCLDNKLKLIRFWESDILNNEGIIIKEIQCSLNQSCQLKK